MKKIFLRFFTYVGILYLTDNFINGFELKSSITLMALALALAVINLIIKPLVKFLTLQVNGLTTGSFNALATIGLMYLFNFIIPGFNILKGFIGPFKNEAIDIPAIKLSQVGVIIVASISISFLNQLVSWTTSSTQGKIKDKKEKGD